MFTLPGLICLLIYLLVRPFYFIPWLSSIPFLYIFFFFAMLGFVVDLARGQNRIVPGPHLPWVIALLAWAILSSLLFNPSSFGSDLELILSPVVYFLMAHGVGNFRDFSRLTGTFLACTITVSAVCTYQALQPLECVQASEYAEGSRSDLEWAPTGHPCEDVRDCYEDLRDPELRFGCERVGPGDSMSVSGRVRYVGVLADPNEASLAICLGIPIAIARFQRRRSFGRLLVLGLALVLAAAAVVYSQSRGGQLVFVTVLGVYFVSRYRWKGFIVGALFALPVLMYGGRSSTEADASANERLGVQMDGIQMFRGNPIFGVGHGNYTEYSTHTAHNSYVFAPAELGFFGMGAWATVLWISFKVVVEPLRRLVGDAATEAKQWGMALLAMLVGLATGVLFLTFNFHYVLWTAYGLTGAYYRCVVSEHPDIRVKIGIRDVALATFANLALIVALYVYILSKGV